jgi:hypothetical protein
MAYSAPINFTAIEAALVSWLRTATGISVAWAKQNRPQPAKPFFALKWTSGPTVVGRDEQRHRMAIVEGNNQLYTDVVGHRELTLNVQAFCDSDEPGSNAAHYVSIALAALSHDTVRLAFETAKISITQLGPVSNLDSIAGAGFESRASFDLGILTVSALIPAEDEPTNWIETAEVTQVEG